MLRSLLLILALCGVAEAFYSAFCYNGTDKDTCGGRYCPTEQNVCAHKKNGKDACSCTHGIGVPTILCGEDGDKFTSLYNDPKDNSYDGESIDVVLPCEYLVTHFKTTRSLFGRTVTCEFKVYGANRRIKGKQFVSSLEVEAKTHGLIKDRTYSFRVDGEASHGRYCFWKHLKCGHGFCSKFTVFPALQLKFDGYKNLAVIDSASCGTTFAFRPADDQLGKDQIWLPGLAVKIKRGFGVQYMSEDKTVSMPEGKTVAKGGPENRPAVDILTYRAIISAAPQIFKWKSGLCNFIKNVFTHCNGDQMKITQAMNICQFAINPSPFLYCWSEEHHDTSSQQALHLYKECVMARCKGSYGLCMAVKSKINGYPKCKNKLENLDAEVLRDNCMFY